MKIKACHIYFALLALTAAAYKGMVKLITPQTAWINIASGKVTASIVVALFIWVYLMEVLSKKRHWTKKRFYLMSMMGLMALLIVASSPQA